MNKKPPVKEIHFSTEYPNFTVYFDDSLTNLKNLDDLTPEYEEQRDIVLNIIDNTNCAYANEHNLLTLHQNHNHHREKNPLDYNYYHGEKSAVSENGIFCYHLHLENVGAKPLNGNIVNYFTEHLVDENIISSETLQNTRDIINDIAPKLEWKKFELNKNFNYHVNPYNIVDPKQRVSNINELRNEYSALNYYNRENHPLFSNVDSPVVKFEEDTKSGKKQSKGL